MSLDARAPIAGSADEPAEAPSAGGGCKVIGRRRPSAAAAAAATPPPPLPATTTTTTMMMMKKTARFFFSSLDTSSVLVVALSLLGAATLARARPLLAAWAIAEGCFYLWQRYRYQLIHSEPVTDAAIEDERMEMLKERLLSLSDVVSLDDFLTGWFRGAPRSRILRGNVEDFIAYGFHCSTLAELEASDPAKRAAVSSFVDDIERRYSTSFSPGRNEGIEFMAHLWEPLRTIHSPLFLRLALESMRLFTVLALSAAGFQRGRIDLAVGARGGRGSSYCYWVLPPSAASHAAALVAGGGGDGNQTKRVKEKDEEEATAVGGDGDGGGDDGVGGDTSLARFFRRRRSHRRTRRSGNLNDGDDGDDDEGGLVVADSASSLEGEDFVLDGDDDGDDKSDNDEEKEQKLSSSSSSPPPPPLSGEEEGGGDPSTAPLVFLHGVGLGITPYLFFIHQLRKRFPKRPLVLVEARHVSIGLVPTRAASTCDVARAVLSVLDRERGRGLAEWRSAAVVAHSYGTFVAARLLALRPGGVQSMVLLDPVCALAIYPQLLANFVYKPPVALCGGEEGLKEKEREREARSGYFWPRQEEEEEEEEGFEGEEEEPVSTCSSSSSSSSALAAAASAASSAAATARALLTAVDSARFLFSRDLTVGEAFCRRFAWHRECLWPQDLRHGGRSTLFGLAGGDDLVPGELVRRALRLSRSRAAVAGNCDDRRAGHGGFLLDLEWQRRLLDGAEVVVGAGAEEEAKELLRREKEKRRGRGGSWRRTTTTMAAAATKAAALAFNPLAADDDDSALFKRTSAKLLEDSSDAPPSFAPASPPPNNNNNNNNDVKRMKKRRSTASTTTTTSDGKAAASYSRRAVVPLAVEKSC